MEIDYDKKCIIISGTWYDACSRDGIQPCSGFVYHEKCLTSLYNGYKRKDNKSMDQIRVVLIWYMWYHNFIYFLHNENDNNIEHINTAPLHPIKIWKNNEEEKISYNLFDNHDNDRYDKEKEVFREIVFFKNEGYFYKE